MQYAKSIDDSEGTNFGKVNPATASVVNLTDQEKEEEIVRCERVIK